MIRRIVAFQAEFVRRQPAFVRLRNISRDRNRADNEACESDLPGFANHDVSLSNRGHARLRHRKRARIHQRVRSDSIDAAATTASSGRYSHVRISVQAGCVLSTIYSRQTSIRPRTQGVLSEKASLLTTLS